MQLGNIQNYIQTKLCSHYGEAELPFVSRWLLEELLQKRSLEIWKLPNDWELSEGVLDRLDKWLYRLQQGEPIQYVMNKAWFYGREFVVTPDVLIPRPETEEMCQALINYCRDMPSQSIVDIGTGSGAIAITLDKALPQHKVYGFDISAKAISVAEQNSGKWQSGVHFFTADLFAASWHKAIGVLSIIISNPPYVCEKEKSQMSPRVYEHEPLEALFVPSSDPLRYYREIASQGEERLLRGGCVFVEVNEQFAQKVSSLFESSGFQTVRVFRDMQGKERFVQFLKA